MKTTRTWIGAFSVMMALAVGAEAKTEMSVQIREGQLRERPSYLGTVVTTVEYGERVQIQREQGLWRFVRFGEREGWIHESALTSKRIKLAAGEENAAGAASQDEMAMAGKGFSSEVEGEFRAANQDIDFSWVDKMETWGVGPERLAAFLREGGVEAPKGAE